MSTEEVPESVHVKINLPAKQSIEFESLAANSVFEIRAALKDIAATQTFTNYQLTHGGASLGDAVTLADIAKDSKISMDLSLVAYTELSAREHVNIVRKLASLDVNKPTLQQIVGEAHGASSWDAMALEDIKIKEEEEQKSAEEAPKEGEEAKGEDAEPKKPELTEEEKVEASKLIAEILSIGSSTATVAGSKKVEYLRPALKSLALSPWNPVTVSRRAYGDLFYLTIKTLEGENVNVTASVSGFFINNTTDNRFDPSIKQSAKVSKTFSLLNMLVALSPKFSEQVKANDQVYAKIAPELYVQPSSLLLSNPWLAQKSEPAADLARSQVAYFQSGSVDAGLSKDWNAEYQTAKDVVIENATPLVRDNLFIEISSQFNLAAIEGAMAVARGEIEPLNPEEAKEDWSYLKNGIFYSKPTDSLGHYADSGEESTRVAAAKDVAAVKLMNKYDLDDVHCLLTTVIDYCGQRIVAQAPVPGIFTDAADEKATSVQTQYGYTNGQSNLLNEESIAESFKVIGEAFSIKPHKVWTEDGETVIDVYTSAYTNGLYGTDGKKYAVDLCKTTPLDIEFIEKHVDFSKEDSYPHKVVHLRREAVSEWVRRETAVAIKKETERIEKEGKKSSEEKPTIGVDPSLFALNPDAFCLPKAPNAELAAQLAADEADVRNVSEFLNKVLIPEFVDEQSVTDNQNPIDGIHLSELLHSRGINMRYLGDVARLALEKKNEFSKIKAAKKEELSKINEVEDAKYKAKIAKAEAKYKAQLEAQQKGEPIKEDEEEEKEEETELVDTLTSYPNDALLNALYKLSVEEMIARGTKHYLRKLLENVPLVLASTVISHIFNLLLASKANPTPSIPEVDAQLLEIYPEFDITSLNVSAKDVHQAIAKEVSIRFRFQLPETWVDDINVLSLWRNVSIKFGIQWTDRAYAFTNEELNTQIETQTTAIEKAVALIEKTQSKKKGKKVVNAEPKAQAQTTTFVPSDITAIVPVTKDSIYDSALLQRVWASITNSIKEDTTTSELFSQLSIMIDYAEQLYGPVHRQTAVYMSRISAILNSYPEGDVFARKAFQIFERYYGADSYQSALSLNQLINIEVSHEAFVNGFKLLKRLINQWTVAHGEYHPTVISSLNTVFILCLNLNLKEQAVATLKKMIELSDKTYGDDSVDSAIFRYRLSQILPEFGQLKEASKFAAEGYSGMLSALGLLNKNTVDARTWTTQLDNYIKYSSVKRKADEREARAAAELAAKNKAATTKNATKEVSSDPTLANKSIDDILAFINGA